MQPPTLPTEYFVILSAVLFILGIVGVLVRRNAILIFMSIELMLNAANLALVAFARQWGNMGGQMTVFFVISIAAAEVAVGLALIVAIFKTKKTIDIDELNTMKG
ncbi:MAG TPA: NADH-quinone oxidoreductase subunit NuoK [Aggregatilineales bacterium]|nr:NADH-quinone oxidoreductase subunit NuoK [Anaerolineales bacterium]HRE48531.1 NADH-quinone oxidoreductase subunit NuoK [Aggregatilineales bacterium]